MKGISFGQEPDSGLGPQNSFNNLREGIFNFIYQHDHISVDSPDFDRKFLEYFKLYKVDPKNPAFNWPPEKGSELFSVIAANSY